MHTALPAALKLAHPSPLTNTDRSKPSSPSSSSMAGVHLPKNDPSADEDYIDIDFASASATFLLSSPPEFEFQMTGTPEEATPMASPADELFYKGKLLPLRLPSSLFTAAGESIQQPASSIREFKTAAAAVGVDAVSSTAATPYMSCNASPVASCFARGELSAEDFFHECSEELSAPQSGDHHRLRRKKSWARKLKFIKEATLSLKQKASGACIRSFFAKSWRSSEKCTVLKAEQTSHGGFRIDGKMTAVSPEEKSSHRRSFSAASTNWQYSSTKSSSISSSSSFSSSSSSKSTSFSSVNSKDFHGPQPPPSSSAAVLRRSSSVNSDMESSIQGAIAYCKKSQQVKDPARKSASDVGFCLLSGTRIAPDGENEKAII